MIEKNLTWQATIHSCFRLNSVLNVLLIFAKKYSLHFLNSNPSFLVVLMSSFRMSFQKQLRLVYKPHFRNHVPINRYRKCNIAINYIRMGESTFDIALFQNFRFKVLKENLYRLPIQWLHESLLLHSSLV